MPMSRFVFVSKFFRMICRTLVGRYFLRNVCSGELGPNSPKIGESRPFQELYSWEGGCITVKNFQTQNLCAYTGGDINLPHLSERAYGTYSTQTDLIEKTM